MKPATLRTWIKRRGLSHQEAADLLGISRGGLRKNLYGVRPIGEQTERIIELLDNILKNETSEIPRTPRRTINY